MPIRKESKIKEAKKPYKPRTNQAKLARVWVDDALSNRGMSFREMVMAAGYSQKTADIIPGRPLRAPAVQQEIQNIIKDMRTALQEKGIGPEYLTNKLHLMLEGKFE